MSYIYTVVDAKGQPVFGSTRKYVMENYLSTNPMYQVIDGELVQVLFPFRCRDGRPSSMTQLFAGELLNKNPGEL